MTNDVHYSVRDGAPRGHPPATSRGLDAEIALIRTLVRELYDDRDVEGRIGLLLQAAGVLTRMVAAHYKLGGGELEQLSDRLVGVLGLRDHQMRPQEDV